MFYKDFHEHQPDPRIREDDEEVLSEQYYAKAGIWLMLKRTILNLYPQWLALEG
jgi:hypothetical protein